MQDSGMSVCPTTWPYFLTHFLMAGKMGLIVACKKGFRENKELLKREWKRKSNVKSKNNKNNSSQNTGKKWHMDYGLDEINYY